MRIHRKLLRVATLGVALACLIPCASRAADPEEAQYNVVVTLYNAGQWEAALRKIAERESLSLTDVMRARYLYAKGLALEKGGKAADARQAYEALIAKYPQAAEVTKARLVLVFADHASRNYDGVIARFAEVRQDALSAAEKQQLVLMLGEAWSAKGDSRKALEAYEQAVKLGADRQALAPRLFAAYHQLQRHQDLLSVSASGVAGVDAAALAAVRSESLLALGKAAEAEAEARKVPADGPFAGRASFTAAQALIRLGKLKEAEAPLETAIRLLKDPPVPPSAYLALADCQAAAGKPEAAARTLDHAATKIRALPEAERKPLLEQAALARIRLAAAAKDPKAMAAAVEQARSALPADRLPAVLYARLYALQEAGDDDAILKSLGQDAAVFDGKPEEGSAVLIYAEALRRRHRAAEGAALLEKLLARRADGPDAAKARHALANAAISAGDFAKAREQLKGLLAMPDAATRLGPAAYAEAVYNSAVAAVRTGDPAAALSALSSLAKAGPGPELAGKAWTLQGQLLAQTNDFRGAAAAWRQALAQGKGVDEADVRDRLGRALLAAGDGAGARQEFGTLAKLAGGEEKLKRETREAWARAAYEAKDYGAAAEAYRKLYEAFPTAPVYAFECAVAFEHLDRWAEAEQWYGAADKDRGRLPAEYAAVVGRNLSAVRFRSGTGDMGADYWIERLKPATPDADFDSALTALAKVAGRAKLGAGSLAGIAKAHEALPPESPRHYGAGAVRLLLLAGRGDWDEVQRLAPVLAAGYAAREASLPPRTWATTVAPAIIHFMAGEANRRAGNVADALVSYETVLAAYPFNEWPDAAACGAAECYAVLGDSKTAVDKLNDVIRNAKADSASAKWIEQARQRVKELTGGH